MSFEEVALLIRNNSRKKYNMLSEQWFSDFNP